MRQYVEIVHVGIFGIPSVYLGFDWSSELPNKHDNDPTYFTAAFEPEACPKVILSTAVFRNNISILLDMWTLDPVSTFVQIIFRYLDSGFKVMVPCFRSFCRCSGKESKGTPMSQ